MRGTGREVMASTGGSEIYLIISILRAKMMEIISVTLIFEKPRPENGANVSVSGFPKNT